MPDLTSEEWRVLMEALEFRRPHYAVKDQIPLVLLVEKLEKAPLQQEKSK